MSQRTSTQRRAWKERALSLLLAAALVVGLVPGLTLPASAAHWADSYLDQLVDQGILRADQVSNPDADLTRAEFMAIVNRAYGYTETGPIPFEDVLPTDWFYDDISIAYTAGYMAGTSETTASPNDSLTREQAVCILGRNMMMKETPGESLAFADSRDVSDWARGTVKTAVDNYLISGYPDDTFQPKTAISKGQMAVLVTRCLGIPIQESGTYELGGVFGNLTITAPNVTLRNTTISGDLFISGGVGLGGIKLENVNVLGRIIVSSSGESEGGDASVIMRNVTANEMLVDNMRNKTVTIRADGITDIAKTVVRTNAYLEDNNTDDKGLMRIELNGEPGIRLTLAGRIKEVLNKTPSSFIQLSKGTVAKITVDEAATYSTVQLDRNTKAHEVNLDVATSVLGDGDIGKLNVNAPGSVVTMLPDNIYVRPGLTASVAGVIMDYQAAQEGSLDPRLLSGYPAASDIAPTGFRADFAGNKKGTIYWAVSYVSDGSIGENDLISPPSYGNKAIVNGSVEAPTGGDEVSAQISNLVVGGSYYLSAVLVDEQKERSPVKVISFSTPDNTVPAFAQGYPQMSRISAKARESVVSVMPTKSCKLYYALLPQGAPAPTANELKAAAVTGNLGYGVRDVTKSTEDVFSVNTQQLEELKTYVLYLWLTDADGANSSNIVSLSFTTPDETPPKFVPDTGAALSGNPGLTNVPLVVGLDEPGTVYWVAVLRGAVYPLPNNQNDDDNVADAAGVRTANLKKDFAKLQVRNGRNGVQSGSVRVANANTDTAMNITGLALETAYDLYYVAVDDAGNYSDEVKKLAINTLDERPPTVRQTFSKYAGRDDTRDPLVSTDIKLDFSEDFRSPIGTGESILDLWAKVSSPDPATEAEAREKLYQLLSSSIELYQTSTSSTPTKVPSWPGTVDSDPPGAVWINYYKAVVTTKDGHVIVTFPYSDNIYESAHRLGSGSTYFFRIQNITDNSDKYNAIVPNPVQYDDMGDNFVPTFTTVFAQVHLSVPQVSAERPYIRNGSPDGNGILIDAGTKPKGEAEIDYTFRLIPESTATVDRTNTYDLQLYTGSSVAFDLYCRIAQKRDTSGEVSDWLETAEQAKAAGITTLSKINKDDANENIGDADKNGWFYLGNSGTVVQKADPPDAGLRGVSVNGNPTMANLLNFPTVSSLNQEYTYDFVITVTEQGGVPERGVWTGKVDFEVHVLAGAGNILKDGLASDAYAKERDRLTGIPLTGGGLVSIGQTTSGDKFLTLTKTFIDRRVPRFGGGYPRITPGDSFADVGVNLDRAGTLYYVAIPMNGVNTRASFSVNGTLPEGKSDNSTLYSDYEDEALWNLLPPQGQNVSSGGDIQIKYQYTGAGLIKDRDDTGVVYDIKINTPNATQIMTQTTYEAYPHGVLTYGGGATTVNVPLRGLTANTPYIVYFVLKGVADTPSPVFAYRFTTNESSKPRITLVDGLNGEVSIDTSYGKSGVASDLSWIVFARDDGIKALGTKKIGNIDVSGAPNYASVDEDNNTLTENGKPMMDLLESLMTVYDADKAGDPDPGYDGDTYGSDMNGYTLFDLFASVDQKRALDNMVRSPGALQRASTGTAVTDPDTEDPYIDYAEWLDRATNLPKPPASSSRFLIFVVGHNIASSTGDDNDWSPFDSFAALDDVRVMDSAPPKLKEVNGELWGNGVSGYVNFVGTGTGATLRGQIVLTFDKDIYWRVRATDELQAVVGNNPGDEEVALLDPDKLSYPLSQEGTFSATGNGDFFTISFSAVVGPTVQATLLSSGRIHNESGTATDDRITITIGWEDDDQTGHRTPYFTVKFGSQEYKYTGNWIEIPTTTVPAVPQLVGDIGVTDRSSAGGIYNFDLILTFDSIPYYTVSGVHPAVEDITYNCSKPASCTVTPNPIMSGGSTSYIIEVRGLRTGETIILMGGPANNNSSFICDKTGQKVAASGITIGTTQKPTGPLSSMETYVTVNYDFGYSREAYLTNLT